MNLSQIISLAKTASDLVLNQKNVSFFEEATYQKGNSTLNAFGIDTNTVLGGVFSGDVVEVLKGGTVGGGDVADGIASFILSTEPLEAGIVMSSEVMQHPIEYNIARGKEYKEGINSAQNFIADHQIIQPIQFKVALVLPSYLYTSVIEEINTLMKTKKLLSIVTKAGTYRRMCLRGASNAMKVENISRLIFELTFREIQIQFPETAQSLSPNNASIDSGSGRFIEWGTIQ